MSNQTDNQTEVLIALILSNPKRLEGIIDSYIVEYLSPVWSEQFINKDGMTRDEMGEFISILIDMSKKLNRIV
jgi:hypothetical protein